MNSSKSSNNAISKQLSKYSKRFGLENINAHAIRRAYAKNLLQKGASIAVISMVCSIALAYTESTKDIPLGWELKEIEGLTFTMASDLPKGMIPKMFFLKKPLKAFERTILKQDKETNQLVEEEMQGTFYDVSNTHSVEFNVLMYCMANDEIGTIGFYLYSWLKHRHDIFRSGYDVSYEKLSAETGIPRRTMIEYLKALKSYNLISFKFNQEFYVIGMSTDDRMATTYYANSFSNFYEEPKPFKKMMVMTKDSYSERNDVIVTEEQLPF